MLFIRSCCLLHVHAPLTHMHLGARTARSAVKLENAHTLSAALPMHACLLVATLHLRARGQARANVCRALWTQGLSIWADQVTMSQRSQHQHPL